MFSSIETAQYKLAMEREDHKEKIGLFRETEAVEQALLKQLTAALPALYFEPYSTEIQLLTKLQHPSILSSLT